MAEAIEIISRPRIDIKFDPKTGKPVPEDGQVEVVSRPKTPEPTTFTGRLAANWREGMQDSAEGMARVLGRDLSPWERVKGAGQALMGGMEAAGAPVTAAGRTLVGAPVENTLKDAGVPPWLAEMTANTADLGAQVAAGSAVPKAVKALPGAIAAAPRTAQEIMATLRQGVQKAPEAINTAATKAGGVARSTINAADDIVKQRMTAAERAAAEKAAKAPPSREQLTKAKDAAYAEASRLGADVKPEAFGTFADNVPAVLKAEKVTSGTIPLSEKIYPNTKALADRLEEYRGHQLTIENLQMLQQEASDFVRDALVKSQGNRKALDVRGSQILTTQVRDFIQNLKPEQIVGGADPTKALEALNKAKELARRNFKLADIETILDVAKRLNKPELVQQEFTALAKDDLAMKNFSAAERKLIDQIAAESTVDSVLDFVPKVGRTVRKATDWATRSGRMKKAQDLIDMIARGEAAQMDAAAAKAAQPSVLDRFGEAFLERPGRGLGPARNPNLPPDAEASGGIDQILERLRGPDKNAFAGTLNVVHGSPQKGLQAFRDPARVNPDFRYDGGGKGSAAYGHHTYFDERGNWVDNSMSRGINKKGGVYDVMVDFKKAFVLTPDTIEAARKAAGLTTKDGVVNGAQLAAKLKEKGYDGLIVRGFDDWEPKASKAAMKMRDDELRKLVKDGYPWNAEGIGKPLEEWEAGKYEMLVRGLTDDAGQDQVISFYPHKNAKIIGKRNK